MSIGFKFFKRFFCCSNLSSYLCIISSLSLENISSKAWFVAKGFVRSEKYLQISSETAMFYAFPDEQGTTMCKPENNVMKNSIKLQKYKFATFFTENFIFSYKYYLFIYPYFIDVILPSVSISLLQF